MSGDLKADYVMYADNDDDAEQDHVQNYLEGIYGTDADLVYFNSRLVYNERVNALPVIRDTRLEEGMIGHAEIIVKAEFIKKHGILQDDKYGHDWRMIKKMLDLGAKALKDVDARPTYKVMGAGDLREQDID
jgi:hypothetical protein